MLKKLDKLGEGAYSKVYKVQNGNKTFALKVCLKEMGNSFGMPYKEYDISLRVSHPNIAYLYKAHIGVPFSNNDVASPLKGDQSNMMFDMISLQYELATCSLFDYCLKNVLNFEDIQSITCDVLLGLEHLHGHGYMHRDIRTDNVLIFDSEENGLVAKIADLGTAKTYIKYDVRTPRVNCVKYRSPECLVKPHNYGFGIDSWGVGCVLYSMIQNTDFCKSPAESPNHVVLEELQDIIPRAMEKEWSEFCPLSAQAKDELAQFSSEEELKKLLMGLVCIDPRKRLTIKKALDLNFFDTLREQILETRKTYPVVKTRRIMKIAECHERTKCYEVFSNIRDNKTNYSWYSNRVFFFGIDIFERCLVKQTEGKQERKPNSIMGNYMLIKNAKLLALVSLYLSLKYFYGVDSKIVAFDEMFPGKYEDEYYEQASNLEVSIVVDLLESKLYEGTIYDALLKERVSTEDDEISILSFLYSGHYENKSFRKAFSIWKDNRNHYLKYRI